MSREIKFRAWDKGKRLFSGVSDGFVHTGRFCVRLDGRIYDTNLPDTEWSKEEIILMQYTGLKDKNGKEIYEGDILLQWDKKYIVRWDEIMAAFQSKNIKDSVDTDFFNWGSSPSLRTQEIIKTGWSDESNCEIIGNIYENPELLHD